MVYGSLNKRLSEYEELGEINHEESEYQRGSLLGA
jgi:hypothetical protein